MKDPFAASTAPRLKPVDVLGFPAPIDLRQRDDGKRCLTVGRADDNDVALTGGDFPSVSSHHVRFDLVEGELTVRDLGSKNGTLVNGETIEVDRVLEIGDQVRLGSVGPKFVIVGATALDETVFVRSESVGRSERDVEKIVRRGTRANFRRIVALVTILACVAGWFVWDTTRNRARMDARGLEQEDELRSAWTQIAAMEQREQDRDTQAATMAKERAERIRLLEQRLAERTTELEATIDERSAEESRLQKRIEELEERGASRDVLERVERELMSARADLDATRLELTDAQRRVDMFDPVSVAQARLSGVGQVRRSVVLIESRMRIRNVETGASMYIDEQEGPNFEENGEEFTLESTGSGFCVDAEGWILTNAHVVEPPDSRLLRALSKRPEYEQVLDLAVVFSGDSTRHVATVDGIAEDSIDLALVKIDPFDGMPTLTGFGTDVPPPPAGSDIYLFGFPLGHLAIQEGETVIASTFRGILSRNVGGQMQVDAGVHPGNSGGPITDSQGRVIGVVVSVQALPDRTAVYTIGYGIPIAESARLWPRRPKPPVAEATTEMSEYEAANTVGTEPPD